MKTFIPFVMYSVLLLAFYAALGDTQYAVYAENYISFIGVILLVGAVAGIITHDRTIKKGIENPDYKASSSLKSSITILIRIFAAVVTAMSGWYFVATGFLLYTLVCLVQDDHIQKGKARG